MWKRKDVTSFIIVLERKFINTSLQDLCIDIRYIYYLDTYIDICDIRSLMVSM